MTILVVGAGATGGYFGARLAQAGRDVTFLVRPHRAGQLRERGLRIIGPGAGAEAGQVVRPNLVMAGELTEPADVVLLSVKATALEAAIADFARAVGPRTAVVPFLNGMAHLALLSNRFGESAVLGGVVVIAVQLNDEGDVVQLSPPVSMTIGAQDGTRTAQVQHAYGQLSGAGFDASVSDEVIARMWQKWVFIATIGAMTSLMRGTVGDIVAVPGGRDLGPAILAEATAVASAAGPSNSGQSPPRRPPRRATRCPMTRSPTLRGRSPRPGPRSTRRCRATWPRAARPRSRRSWPTWPGAAPSTGSRPRCSTWPRCNCASTTTACTAPAERSPAGRQGRGCGGFALVI
jgi:2-dehydropantoate 2-reductase